MKWWVEQGFQRKRKDTRTSDLEGVLPVQHRDKKMNANSKRRREEGG